MEDAIQVDTMTPEPLARVVTSVTPDDALLHSPNEIRHREWDNGWQQVIDHKLIEWGRCPEQLEEDDLIPPTQTAVEVGCWIAAQMRDAGEPAPKRVVPDRDGGIVFERWVRDSTVSIMVSGDGEIEIVRWVGSTVVETRRIG